MCAVQKEIHQWKWTKRRILKLLAAAFTLPLCLCACAGKWLWPQAWFVIVAQFTAFSLAATYIYKDNPSLFPERERFCGNEGTAGFDKVLATMVVTITPFMYLAAGLQHCYHLAPTASFSSPLLQAFAVVLDLFALFFECWAMCTNHWFSSVVRIQTDRGHKVCSQGPYKYVRHPGYVGASLQLTAESVLLESSWSCWFAVARVVVLVVRTAFEDAMLKEQLPGYAAYAATVRYRLLPFVW